MADQETETPGNTEETPPVFNMRMSIEEETQEITDADEAQARQFLVNHPGALVLITKLAIAGNLAKEYANPCKQEKRLQSYEFSPGEDLESLYSYVQENYEGGKYRFQLRKGQRNGKVWQITLADLPGTKPRAEARHDDDDRQEQTLHFQQREPEKSENPLKTAKSTMKDHLDFMKDIKEIFGDILGAQPAAAAQQPKPKTREETLIELASIATEPEIKKRIFDAIIGDEKETPPPRTFADVITDILSNPDVLQKPISIIAPAIMPHLAPYIGAMFPQQQPANGATIQPPPQPFTLNPPASLQQPPPTAAAEQTGAPDQTADDGSKKRTPARNPRKLPLNEIQETE